jgi:lipopolysaccharide export system permease protein
MPQLIARFLPYSVLLATIITLVTLNQNSEVVAMKAAGLSAHQVLAPLLLTARWFRLSASPSTSGVVTRANGDAQGLGGGRLRPDPRRIRACAQRLSAPTGQHPDGRDAHRQRRMTSC